MHCLEGGRLFMTQSGALQTPDWISNRHFIYASDLGQSSLPGGTAATGEGVDVLSERPQQPTSDLSGSTLLADGSAGSFATCLKNFGIDTFPEWLEDVQRSEAPVILDEQAWREIQIPGDHVTKGSDTVCYGKSVSVWPSASLMRMEKRFWNNRVDYDTQINVIYYPTIVCPTCSSRHPDGVVILTEWSPALSARLDLSPTRTSR